MILFLLALPLMIKRLDGSLNLLGAQSASRVWRQVSGIAVTLVSWSSQVFPVCHRVLVCVWTSGWESASRSIANGPTATMNNVCDALFRRTMYEQRMYHYLRTRTIIEHATQRGSQVVARHRKIGRDEKLWTASRLFGLLMASHKEAISPCPSRKGHPASISMCTTSRCPPITARCKGLHPVSFSGIFNRSHDFWASSFCPLLQSSPDNEDERQDLPVRHTRKQNCCRRQQHSSASGYESGLVESWLRGRRPHLTKDIQRPENLEEATEDDECDSKSFVEGKA